MGKIYKLLIKNDNSPSFVTNLVAFNSTIRNLAFKVIKYFFGGTPDQIKFIANNKDNRNYRTESNNLNKYFKNLKFSNFNYELNQLIKGIKKYKIKSNTSTIRMKFYKKNF